MENFSGTTSVFFRFCILCENFSKIGPIIKKIPKFSDDPLKCIACQTRYVWLKLEFEKKPIPPSVPIWHRSAKHSILILEGIIKKISYERRDYELVDEKSLS